MPKNAKGRETAKREENTGVIRAILLGIVALAVVVVAVQFYISLTSEAYPPNATYNQSQTKLADTYFGPHSYLISGPTLDNASIAATNGFTVIRSVLQNGTISVTLISVYNITSPKTFLLSNGEQLYYLELAYADDHPESTITDDKVVLTDAAGYILKIDTP